MTVLDQLCLLVAQILECEIRTVRPETRLFEDLECESIDLFEIGAGLNVRFQCTVDDTVVFLRDADFQCEEARRKGESLFDHLSVVYPHLASGRIARLEKDLRDSHNVFLCIADLVDYVVWQQAQHDTKSA